MRTGSRPVTTIRRRPRSSSACTAGCCRSAAENPDRRVLRQQPHARDAAVVEHAQHALARAARRRGRAAGRDRSGDVHASASRSRRLEHTAEGRPLGADVSERALRVLEARRRLLPQGRSRSEDRAGRVRHVPRMRAADRRSRPRRSGRRHASAQRSYRDRAGARSFARPCGVQARKRRAAGAFIGDVFHHLLQVYYPHWNFPKNSDAEQARVSRRAVLEHCAATGALVFPGHVGAPFAGYIEAAAKGFQPRFH